MKKKSSKARVQGTMEHDWVLMQPGWIGKATVMKGYQNKNLIKIRVYAMQL